MRYAPRSSPSPPRSGGARARSNPLTTVVEAGAPITIVRRVIRNPQHGHCQPSTPNTRLSKSAHPGASTTFPAAPRRFTSLKESRASAFADSDVATFGITAFRHPAFPARTPLYNTWFARAGGTIAASFSTNSRTVNSTAPVPSLRSGSVGGDAEVGLGGLGTKGRGSGGSGGGNFGSKGEGGIGSMGPDPVIVGALDKFLIDAVIKRNMNQIRYCYQREITKNPALGGKITVKFVIAKDGTVSSATTEASTMGSPAVEACINGRFMRFAFPEPRGGGIVIVSYPFEFSPG